MRSQTANSLKWYSTDPDNSKTTTHKFAFVGDFFSVAYDGSQACLCSYRIGWPPKKIRSTHVFDFVSGKVVDSIPGFHDEFLISPDNGSYFMSTSDGFMLIDRKTKEVVWKNDSVGYRDFRFSPSGKWLFANSIFGENEVLDATTGKLQFKIPSQDFYPCTSLFTEDEKRIVVAEKRVGAPIEIWNLESGVLERTIDAKSKSILRRFVFPVGLILWSIVWVWQSGQFSLHFDQVLSRQLLRLSYALGGAIALFVASRAIESVASHLGLFGRMPTGLQVLTISICAAIILFWVLVFVTGLSAKRR